MKFFVLLTILLSVLYVRADIYSVIVAGSSEYHNYRHQADVCHAYQLLIANGVKADNIIVMAFDDIANNINNPWPGKIFNIGSGDKPGNDVYEGCVIDYKGMDVTKSNYFAILRGDSKSVKGGNGRVLESGPDDEVFLFYSDHGNVGYVKFPDPEGYIYKDDGETQMFADELNDILKEMSENKKFSQLTYYMNACHSGSMFDGILPNNINVYTVSAANADQSGYGCFCPPYGDRVDGVGIDACLSSQFPASWMQNTEYTDTNAETLQQQFEFTKKATTLSEVQQWGDLSMTDQSVATFIGGENQDDKPIRYSFLSKLGQLMKNVELEDDYLHSSINSSNTVEEQRMIEMNYYLRKYKANPSIENYSNLQKDLAISAKFAQAFETFDKQFGLVDFELSRNTNYGCYRKALGSLERQCGRLNDFSLDYSRSLYQYCSANSEFPKSYKFDC